MNLPKALVLTVAATTFCLMTSPAFAVEETTGNGANLLI